MNAKLAEEAALQSALISGFNPKPKKGLPQDSGRELEDEDPMYKIHRGLISDVLGCKTGILTSPIIVNMSLCGDREKVKYRQGIRAAEAEFLPDAKYVRQIFKVWWWLVELQAPKVRKLGIESREEFCWKQHDFLISLEPFARANGRTARVVYYMLATALNVPIHIIGAAKAQTYNAHRREYREKEFSPLMRAHGYIVA